MKILKIITSTGLLLFTFYILIENQLQKNKINDKDKITISSLGNLICLDVDGNKHNLFELIKNKPVLIYRFSEYHCNSCYEGDISLLHNIFDNCLNRTIILCSYHKENHFSFFRKAIDIKASIYRINHEDIIDRICKFEKPFFFVLHPDYTISDIYYSEEGLYEKTHEYLLRIRDELNFD